MLEQFIPQLDLIEKEYLLKMLKKAIESEYLQEDTEEVACEKQDLVCPHCGCMKISKKGTSTGQQRYLCAECGRNFTARIGKILATTKLPLSTWFDYAVCMINKLSLRACAERYNVGLKTSFFMRHLICECMEGYLSSFEVGTGCSVQIDEMFVRESFTGNHRHNEGFTCPVA